MSDDVDGNVNDATLQNRGKKAGQKEGMGHEAMKDADKDPRQMIVGHSLFYTFF